MPGQLFVPVGPPGSGKSLLAWQACLAGVVPVEGIVSLTEWRRTLTGDCRCQDADRVITRLVDSIAAQRLSRGLAVWIDGKNTGGQLARWVAMATDYQAALTAIVFGSGHVAGIAEGRGRLVVTAEAFRRQLSSNDSRTAPASSGSNPTGHTVPFNHSSASV